ncbi:major facilitator superfamily domain-containing protein [Aspergillus karnatakaensis]|uniref:major facilitator superfamily domain-containing protein n=1 Tax=Aspergillus karnatakaensis TaxID=1810916 RepID=UPI003CCE1AE3
MADVERRASNAVEVEVSDKQNIKQLELASQENAVGYKEYLEALDLEVSDSEYKRVRWKLDLTILPMFLVTQALQFMDKTSLNYANLFGYQEALNLQGADFNHLSAMIYAGYFFGQYPCGWLIGRYPAQKVMAISIFLWGVMAILMTQSRSYSTALAVRFFMGVFEAAVTPGLTLMTGFWYTRREIPLRQCIWYSSLGFGGIVGSYISMGVAGLPADMTPERWELIFYILGGATCLWAFAIWFLLPDAPSNTRFLTHRERLIAVKRVSGNETGIKNKSFDKKQIGTGFMDPKTILIFISVFAAAISNGVVNSFSTIIIRDTGFSTTKTTQLKSVGDGVQVIALLIGGTIILEVPNSRLLTATAANLLCTVSAACMAYLPRSNTWGRLAAFWLVNSTAYCWGNFAGPFVVRQSEAPHFRGATIGLLVGYAIKFGCHLLLLAYMFIVNRRRDAKYGPANKEASDEAGMRDLTEFENKDFRYVL